MPDEKGHRKLLSYLKGLNGEVRVAYEAGPCGYALQRQLQGLGLECDVVAPSLIPRLMARLRLDPPERRTRSPTISLPVACSRSGVRP